MLKFSRKGNEKKKEKMTITQNKTFALLTLQAWVTTAAWLTDGFVSNMTCILKDYIERKEAFLGSDLRTSVNLFANIVF